MLIKYASTAQIEAARCNLTVHFDESYIHEEVLSSMYLV